MGAVKVDRTRLKPRVGIIGEFWAMTTEGDGNYGLQRFLEAEGAEADIQLVTAWLLYMLWQARYDTEQRATLRGADATKAEGGSKFSLKDVDVRKRNASLWGGEKVLRGLFQTFAHAIGLYDYHLPDMNEIAEISHAFYDNNLRGGEGHMEVGKLIQNVAYQKVNMTLSVKPFGCMPSSSVSDGIQSFITELYPQGIFLPIETNGDGAVNVYSRVQMQLFKAKQLAQKEVDKALADVGMTIEEVRAYLDKHPSLAHAFHRARAQGRLHRRGPHLRGRRAQEALSFLKERVTAAVTGKEDRAHAEAHQKLLDVARRAAAKANKKKSVVTVAPEVDPDDQAAPHPGRPQEPARRQLAQRERDQAPRRWGVWYESVAEARLVTARRCAREGPRGAGSPPGKAGDLRAAPTKRSAARSPTRPSSPSSARSRSAPAPRRGRARPPSPPRRPLRAREPAPVIVYHMDKTRRDALKLTEILDGAGIPYQISNIQEDPAAQMAVRRDSKGFRLPVVFIAGEPIGGRAELTNLQTSGELSKKVFG